MKPLKRRIKVDVKGEKSQMVDVKYERLNVFCFCCGILGHNEMECSSAFRLNARMWPQSVNPGKFLKAPGRQKGGKAGFSPYPGDKLYSEKGRSDRSSWCREPIPASVNRIDWFLVSRFLICRFLIFIH